LRSSLLGFWNFTSNVRVVFGQQIALTIFVFLLVFSSVFSSGLASTFLGGALTDSPDKLAETFGLSDAGSYLSAAIELHDLDGLSANQYWVINLWPPGMVLLNATLIAVFGPNFSIAYALLTGLAWSLFFTFFALQARKVWGWGVAATASALVIASGPFQNWIFSTGLFYAEGFSQLFFLVSLISLIKASRADGTASAVALGMSSGTALAVAAYFRAGFSTLEFLLLLSALTAVFCWFLSSRISKWNVRADKLKRLSIVLGSAWASMFLLMEPWLQYTSLEIREIRTWSVVSGSIFRGVWRPRDQQAGFVASGGGGWGCELDTSFCSSVVSYEEATAELYPVHELALMAVWTALSNPIAYLADRVKFIFEGWFSSEASMGQPGILWGLIALFGLVTLILTMLKRVLSGEFVFLIVLAMIFLMLLPLMIAHVEPRYLIPLKLMIFVLPWVVGVRVKQHQWS